MLNLSYSHNERHPTPMELYYHGNHIATNSFEYGNKDLKKKFQIILKWVSHMKEIS